MYREKLYILTVTRRIEYDFVKKNGVRLTKRETIREYYDFDSYRSAKEYKYLLKNLPGIKSAAIDEVQNLI